MPGNSKEDAAPVFFLEHTGQAILNRKGEPMMRPEFIDYATVAIGLYAAASGMSRREILNIEDALARTSRYAKGTEFDSVYTHLPTTNVYNTDLGYSLYQSGRIREYPP